MSSTLWTFTNLGRGKSEIPSRASHHPGPRFFSKEEEEGRRQFTVAEAVQAKKDGASENRARTKGGVAS